MSIKGAGLGSFTGFIFSPWTCLPSHARGAKGPLCGLFLVLVLSMSPNAAGL
jgi:hypothetical protein